MEVQNGWIEKVKMLQKVTGFWKHLRLHINEAVKSTAAVITALHSRNDKKTANGKDSSSDETVGCNTARAASFK
uniref:Ovule protein n=1 Tax=Loa loa TaxID=7209 RepID=A0A1I7VTM4_LOALO